MLLKLTITAKNYQLIKTLKPNLSKRKYKVTKLITIIYKVNIIFVNCLNKKLLITVKSLKMIKY